MDTISSTGNERGRSLQANWLMFFIAVAAGAAISNNYTLQPALPTVSAELHAPLTASGWIAGSTQAGYMAGILLLVPLGDKVKASAMVACQFLALAAALMIGSFSTSLPQLLIAGFVIGAMATNAVHLSTVAFRVAPVAAQGRALGTVGTGVTAGILLSRFVGGFISQEAGWRAMLFSFGLGALVFAWLAWRLLPAESPRSSENYLALLKSLPGLLRKYGLLREGAAVGACWFFIFSMLWVTLSVHLSEAPLHLTPAQTGLFGFAGLLGLLATRPAGRLTDRIGHRPVILGGFVLVALGSVLLYLSESGIVGTAVGVVLFDVGCFAAQVANQTRLMAIDAKSRSRIYSVYMFIYYAAGTAGSIAGPIVLADVGWQGVCLLSGVLALIGFTITATRHYFYRSPQQ